MADRTGIEWCDSTWNPWIGCTRVSPACAHCYAAVSTPARTSGIAWGAGQPRRRTSVANWKLPLRWNARPFYACRACGWRGDQPSTAGTSLTDGLPSCPACDALALVPARRRVFCASLADVFDNEVDQTWRRDLFEVIRTTPGLDWLLLTKRIGNVPAMLEHQKLHRARYEAEWRFFDDWLDGRPPTNVWLGATICNQAEAERDIPKLLETPAAVRFVSMEPLLGPVDLFDITDGHAWREVPGVRWDALFGMKFQRWGDYNEDTARIDWVIVGGESGAHARPMHPEWARTLRDQCTDADVPFLFKQWGEFASVSEVEGAGRHHHFPDGATVRRVGKKLTGRLLDGKLHAEFPGAARG